VGVRVLLLIVLGGWIGLALAMTAAWIAERRTGNSGWIDVTWTFAVGGAGIILALAAFLSMKTSSMRILVVAGLVALWALRLGLHLVWRTRRINDDPRYAKMKTEMGAQVGFGMFKLAQAQALVSIPLVISIALAAWSPAPWRSQDILAVIVFLIAIAGEAAADRQLRAFRAKPENRDRFCDEGLWRWSRHPNYFFEWLGWLAFPLFAVTLSDDYPIGWLAFVGAFSMYWLLTRVSGIPPLEAHMRAKYGDSFERYMARTSAFFPWFPAKPFERGAT
jgi:steroid 5-alpha reductase family enzyme